MDREVYAVEYALTEDDMVAFANVAPTFLSRHSLDVLRFFAFLAAIAVFLLFGLLSGKIDRWHDPAFKGAAMAVVVTLLIGWFVAERPVMSLMLRRRIRGGRYAELMQSRRLALSSRGVMSRSRGGDVFTPWADITVVAASGAGAYLVSSRRRSYLVPRRVFPSADAFMGFVQTAQELRRLCPPS